MLSQDQINKLFEDLKSITDDIRLVKSFAPDSIGFDMMIEERAYIIRTLKRELV